MKTSLLVLLLAVRAFAGDGVTWQSLGPHPDVRAMTAEPSSDARPFARIFNGTPTGEYPAVAGLLTFTATTVGLCTGTLIAPTVLVTAAHCFDHLPSDAVAGFFPDGFTEQDYRAAAYIVHPDYRAGVAAYADIALVSLAEPVASVTPMPLPSMGPRPRTTGFIVGFGQDQLGRIGLKQKGTVKLRRCPRQFRPAGLLRGQLSTSLCWRPRKRRQDTCQGDSGGPLVVDGAVAGITSGGFPACPGRLSWDTNVALFRPWIESLL